MDNIVINKTSWVPALGAVLAAVAAGSLTIFALLAQSGFWSPDLQPRAVPLSPSNGAPAIVVPGAGGGSASLPELAEPTGLGGLLAAVDIALPGAVGDGAPGIDETDGPADPAVDERRSGVRPSGRSEDDDYRGGKKRWHSKARDRKHLRIVTVSNDGGAAHKQGHGHGDGEKRGHGFGHDGPGPSAAGAEPGRRARSSHSTRSSHRGDQAMHSRGNAKGHSKKHKRC